MCVAERELEREREREREQLRIEIEATSHYCVQVAFSSQWFLLNKGIPSSRENDWQVRGLDRNHSKMLR